MSHSWTESLICRWYRLHPVLYIKHTVVVFWPSSWKDLCAKAFYDDDDHDDDDDWFNLTWLTFLQKKTNSAGSACRAWAISMLININSKRNIMTIFPWKRWWFRHDALLLLRLDTPTALLFIIIQDSLRDCVEALIWCQYRYISPLGTATTTCLCVERQGEGIPHVLVELILRSWAELVQQEEALGPKNLVQACNKAMTYCNKSARPRSYW